jgi:hypothetical protein
VRLQNAVQSTYKELASRIAKLQADIKELHHSRPTPSPHAVTARPLKGSRRPSAIVPVDEEEEDDDEKEDEESPAAQQPSSTPHRTMPRALQPQSAVGVLQGA